MRKVILNALAFAENAGIPTQVKDVADIADTYIKNAFVSLTSVKLHNPDLDVCLITNRTLTEAHNCLFTKHQIHICVIPFDAFAIPNTFHWQLAFFKLFALEYAVNHLDYEQYLLIDSDVYSTKNINDLWNETEPGSILLYQLPSTYNERTRKEIIDGYKLMYGKQKNIANYGGEFIAGNKEDLKAFSEECMKVYGDVLANLDRLSRNIGDEFITSIAASEWGKKIISVNAYINRFLTGRVYACFSAYELIPMWHMPVEKSYTMIKLYQYYMHNERYPNIRQVASWAGLPHNKRTHALPYFVYRIRQKLAKKFQNTTHKS